MTQVRNRFETASADPGEGVIVRRPRAGDAIGKALRNAFAPEHGLPCELLRSLHAIDMRR